jgi:hypothetical protein
METRLSALAGGVLAAARDVGLGAGTVTYYGRCCAAVIRFVTGQVVAGSQGSPVNTRTRASNPPTPFFAHVDK